MRPELSSASGCRRIEQAVSLPGGEKTGVGTRFFGASSRIENKGLDSDSQARASRGLNHQAVSTSGAGSQQALTLNSVPQPGVQSSLTFFGNSENLHPCAECQEPVPACYLARDAGYDFVISAEA